MPATAHNTVLLVGLGYLGGVLLEILARQEEIDRIVACTRHRSTGEARCNVTRLGLAAEGVHCRIEYRETDVADGDRMAETVAATDPDLILGTATMQTWWLPDLLPPAARQRLQRARFGSWLPLHLAPTQALMRSLRHGDFTGPVLTAPFPDVVNCVLGKIGLAPTCGLGNVDEIAAKVRTLAAEQLAVPLEDVQVLLVAHHALESWALGSSSEEPPPYHLEIRVHGEDVGDTVDVEELLFAPYPLPPGPAGAFLTAGSTVRLVRALLSHQTTPLHAPSPGGLPGGYPILAGAGRVEIDPDMGCSPAIAVEINERSHPFDGIERIEADGTVVLLPETAAILERELGYDGSRLPPAEAAERGRELATKFREYAARHGIDLDRVP